MFNWQKAGASIDCYCCIKPWAERDSTEKTSKLGLDKFEGKTTIEIQKLFDTHLRL